MKNYFIVSKTCKSNLFSGMLRECEHLLEQENNYFNLGFHTLIWNKVLFFRMILTIFDITYRSSEILISIFETKVNITLDSTHLFFIQHNHSIELLI